jgi:hypothetical protein
MATSRCPLALRHFAARQHPPGIDLIWIKPGYRNQPENTATLQQEGI